MFMYIFPRENNMESIVLNKNDRTIDWGANFDKWWDGVVNIKNDSLYLRRNKNYYKEVGMDSTLPSRMYLYNGSIIN